MSCGFRVVLVVGCLGGVFGVLVCLDCDFLACFVDCLRVCYFG